jgi:hypothetical protein
MNSIAGGAGVYGETSASSGFSSGVRSEVQGPGNPDAISMLAINAQNYPTALIFAACSAISGTYPHPCTDMVFKIQRDGHVTVRGIVESTSGGFKFPDGTIQTTAATGGAASGWTDDGALVRLLTDTDQVGIGTSIHW